MTTPSILPSRVAPATRAWVAKIGAGAKGRVLDLGGDNSWVGDRAEGEAVAEVVRLDPVGVDAIGRIDGTFDAVVSVARFPLVADLPTFLAALVDRLSPAGTVGIVEPVWRPGPLRTIRATFRRHAAAAGLHLDRDVVAAMWNAGLSTRWLDRWDLPGSTPGFETFVVAEFRRNRAR